MAESFEGGRQTGALPPTQHPYALGEHLTRTVARAALPDRELPLYRPLRVYTTDPGASMLDGAVATIDVRYEALGPGPSGRLFKVDQRDGATGVDYPRANLDTAYPMLCAGFDPAPSDPRFHQQMVYAVCSSLYATFRTALGRDLTWGFERNEDSGRLWLRPHAFRGINAYYDKQAGTLSFGYDHSADTNGAIRSLPHEYVFSCLSHDIISHEFTHAILDGLRSNFVIPSGADVAAFHEGYADLIAIFQRLRYTPLVHGAIRSGHGTLDHAEQLVELARQAGYAAGHHHALRQALGAHELRRYDENLEPHELGSVLVAAVFDAFLTIYRRKSARFLRLATGGTGQLPSGELPHDLVGVLAEQITKLAQQFQGLLIRAIDYCPPVDIRLGELLRAIITADYDLVRNDPWGYREALIDAFVKRGILPRGVDNLSEQSLLWKPPERSHPLPGLAFRDLRFEGDPASPASVDELLRQAHVLGAHVTQPAMAGQFGLVVPGTPGFTAGAIGAPTVMSIRTARRASPDRRVVFDLVAEVVQCCRAAPANGPSLPVYGGCTVIVGPEGEIRYVISKSPLGSGRIARRVQFAASTAGQRFWRIENGQFRLRGEVFQLMHAREALAGAAPARRPRA